MVFAILRHESAMGAHVSPILNPPPNSLPTSSLWVVPEQWLWVPCFMHRTYTGHLCYLWQYTCFNAILSNHPPHLFPQSPKVCSLHLCLFCCLSYSIIVTVLRNCHIIFPNVACSCANWWRQRLGNSSLLLFAKHLWHMSVSLPQASGAWLIGALFLLVAGTPLWWSREPGFITMQQATLWWILYLLRSELLAERHHLVLQIWFLTY